MQIFLQPTNSFAKKLHILPLCDVDVDVCWRGDSVGVLVLQVRRVCFCCFKCVFGWFVVVVLLFLLFLLLHIQNVDLTVFLNISFLIFDKNFSTFIGTFLQWKMELEVLIFRFSLDFSIAFWLFFSFYFVGLLLLLFCLIKYVSHN